MDETVSLIDLCFLLFQLSGLIDAERDDAYSMEEVKRALDEPNLFTWLRAKEELGDFSLFASPGEYDARGRAITAALRNEAHALSGRERRKIGIQRSGLTYLISLIAELIQSLQWEDYRFTRVDRPRN
jgi:hypothetical protein